MSTCVCMVPIKPLLCVFCFFSAIFGMKILQTQQNMNKKIHMKAMSIHDTLTSDAAFIVVVIVIKQTNLWNSTHDWIIRNLHHRVIIVVFNFFQFKRAQIQLWWKKMCVLYGSIVHWKYNIKLKDYYRWYWFQRVQSFARCFQHYQIYSFIQSMSVAAAYHCVIILLTT